MQIRKFTKQPELGSTSATVTPESEIDSTEDGRETGDADKQSWWFALHRLSQSLMMLLLLRTDDQHWSLFIASLWEVPKFYWARRRVYQLPTSQVDDKREKWSLLKSGPDDRDVERRRSKGFANIIRAIECYRSKSSEAAKSLNAFSVLPIRKSKQPIKFDWAIAGGDVSKWAIRWSI